MHKRPAFLLVCLLLTAALMMPPTAPPVTAQVTCAVEVMLVLDGSGSISSGDFELMRTFAQRVVANLPLASGGARVGVVEFSGNSRLWSPLTDDSSAVTDALSQMFQSGGGTNIIAGLESGQSELQSGNSANSRVIVLLTDGEHSEGGDPLETATRIRNQGTIIIGIAVGAANLSQISALAGGDQNLFFSSNFQGLGFLTTTLLRNVCSAGQDSPPSYIVFSSNRDGDYDLYVMNPDGSDVQPVTQNEAWDDKPSFSPDGRQIAFESDLDGDFEIYVINADGSDLRQLTFNDYDDWGPVWSNDGETLAFHAEQSATDTNVDLYLTDLAGISRRQLFNQPGVDRSAAWSPDGQRLVYYGDGSGGRELYIVEVATGNSTRLTGNAFYDGLPDWSWNGSQIVFASTREQDDVEIYAMRADGSNVTRLTFRPGTDDDPIWSPDSTQIAFESDGDGDLEIFVMNADGSGLTQITDNNFADWSVDWSIRPLPGTSAPAGIP